MRNKKFAGILALTMLVIFAFVGESFALATSSPYHVSAIVPGTTLSWEQYAAQTTTYSVFSDYYYVNSTEYTWRKLNSNCFYFARLVTNKMREVDFNLQTSGMRAIAFSSVKGIGSLSGKNVNDIAKLVGQHLNDVSGTPTEQQVKNIFSSAQIGDVIQFRGWSSKSQHTMVLASKSDSGFETLEGNRPNNSVRNYSISYSDFRSWLAAAGTSGGFSIYHFGTGEVLPPTPDNGGGNNESYSSRPSINQGLRNLTTSSYAKVFTKSSSRYYNLYTNSELTQRRSSSWIDEGEECWITGVGWNSKNVPYAQISFPLSNSSRATAYVSLQDAFVSGTLYNSPKTAASKSGSLARRKNGAKYSSYWIDPGDKVYLLTKEDGWCQVLYPTGNLWRIAWLTESEYNSIIPDVYDFSIKTSQYLNQGYLQKSYNQKLETSPAVSGVTWSVISGTLPQGLNLNASNGTISGTPTKAGTYTFAVRATYNSISKSKAFRISVTNTDEHKDTSINFTYDFKNFYANESYQDYITIQDNSANTNRSIRNYSFRVVSGILPSGLEILEQSYRNGKSVAQVFLRGYATTSRWYTFTLRAKRISDGGYNDKTFSIYIRPSRTVNPWRNSRMYINYTFANGTLGQSYYDWVSVGNGTAPITVTRVGNGELPPGLTVGRAAGYAGRRLHLSGVAKRSGTFNFTLRATGADGGYVEKAFTVTIANNPNYRQGDPDDGKATKPKFSSKKLPNAIIGQDYEAQLEAYGTTPLKWTAEEPLPDGFIIDEDTGRLAGTPTQLGKYRFRIKITNSAGSVTKTLKLKVVREEPTIITESLEEGFVGEEYLAQLEAEGSNPIKWSKSGSLPKGLKLDKTNGIIYGTPKKAGTYNFTIRAKNKAGKFELPMQIIIRGEDTEITKQENPADYNDEAIENEDVLEEDGDTEIAEKATSTGGFSANPNVQEKAEATGNNSIQTALNVLSDDEKFDGSVNISPSTPLNFSIGNWVDEFGRSINVSDVKVLVNDEVVENVEISDKGTFTLSSDLVQGEFTVQAKANSNGREFKTNEINIMASSENENDSSNEQSSSGGCNVGVFGMIICGAVLFLRRKNK